MKSRFLIVYGLLVFSCFAVAETASSEGPHLLYIFATGPDLYDPTGKTRHEKWEQQSDSSYAKKVVDGLIERVHVDHPDAKTLHLKAFTKRNLEMAYLNSSDRNIDRIVLSVVAHGGVQEGVFYIWTDSGKLFEDELLEIIKGSPTEVAFFTCNSGAIRSEEFPGDIFGASLEHTAMDAAHFYGWVSFLASNTHLTFPTSASEIHESWRHYRIHEKVERGSVGLAKKTQKRLKLSDDLRQQCWSGPYPFFLKSALRIVEANGYGMRR